MLNVHNAKLGVDCLGVKLEELMKLPSFKVQLLLPEKGRLKEK